MTPDDSITTILTTDPYLCSYLLLQRVSVVEVSVKQGWVPLEPVAICAEVVCPCMQRRARDARRVEVRRESVLGAEQVRLPSTC